MKLASHYNKVTIIVTLSVLMIGAIIYYFAINHIAKTLLDDHLSEEVAEVIGYVNFNKQLPKQVDFDEDQTRFFKLKNKHLPTRFYDTTYSNPKLRGERAGRAVEGTLTFNNELYKFNIIISKESTEYLVQIIATITLFLVLGLFMVLFLTNRYLLGDLWKPFYKILGQLKAFNISEPVDFDPVKSKVDEFKELDDAVQLMAKRVKGDYQNLKHFTENASHEMLTPLSVITSKLDTFIQDDTLRQEQFEQIQDIYSAAGKLSRLNQSLLLLVKIENDLITGADELDLQELLIEKQRQFQELLTSREITLQTALVSRELTVSKYLIDILLNNLFSNAIRHNVNKGDITIELKNTRLVFLNSGNGNALDPQTIFNRFQKGNNSDGAGLGLTIVKNICSVYGWALSYDYADSLHRFTIVF
ncbi:sensor histidine kinase [Mucilaginibacter glaciei]|uniref:histidine kinase n=1 Tax=Mucilaginibacter glaciei TaxID=2772109 RepID=A0A926S1F9_9SPHI|nr:HAMP domain-containing sensor histidine kinase [Mucilaginibacter glaciei]MBD1393038.1 HAMP domain-containing histidine kinase [Mucilaginibacter glaciei]